MFCLIIDNIQITTRHLQINHGSLFWMETQCALYNAQSKDIFSEPSLQVEHTNDPYKKRLKQLKGQYTDKALSRVSR